MASKILVACHLGNPADTKTWSSTPSNILSRLNSSGAMLEYIPFSSRIHEGQVRIIRKLDRMLMGQFGSIPGIIARYIMGRSVTSIARAQACVGIIHFSTYDLPLCGGRRINRYLFLDNTFDIWATQAHAAASMKPRLQERYNRLERVALRKVRHIFVSGRHVARNLSERYGVSADRITVVGTGLGAVQPYYGGKRYENGEILSVVKERPIDKGLPLLMEAFSIARESKPELKLTVIGAEKFKDISPSENVLFTGWITEDELQEYFERASLFVLPASYEPWGLSFLEALACKVPILGIDRNAFPEFCAENRYGRALPVTVTAADLAAAMLDQLSNVEKQIDQGLAGQKYCLETFSWDRVVGSMSHFINTDMSDSYVVSSQE
ncbi:MAG: hypothetical protein CMN84_09145 [Spongiibacteraceae bacterium]|nr:hypothetical protein [Spongiibacteraceae bacterium]